MKKSFIFYIILTTKLAFSQDVANEARIQQNYSENELKRFADANLDGDCIGNTSGQSLYDKSRPLEGVVQQDQDGLNTCYANAASIILKSYNPNLPTPSYLDLASINRLNKQNSKNKYEFDYGNTCFILNKVKEDNPLICGDEILENRPASLQDEILKKLYDVINTYNYTPTQMIDVLKRYERYLVTNPSPRSVSCSNNQLTLEKYISFRFQRLSSSDIYYNQDEWSEEDENASQKCATLVKAKMVHSKILVPSQSEESKKYYGDYEINPKIRIDLNQKYLKQMKANVFPSGKTQYEYFVELLDSGTTSSATYERVLGGGARSDNYRKFLAQIAKEVNQQVLDGSIQNLAKDNPEIQACFNKAGRNLVDPVEALFFNTALSDCYKEQTKWRSEVFELTKSCHDPEKDLYLIFRNLSLLNQSINDIEKFLVDKNKNILKQIIDNNCTQSHHYKLPEGTCHFQVTQPFSASIKKLEDHPYYQLLQEDVTAFIPINNFENKDINFDEFAAFLKKKYGSEKKTDSPLHGQDIQSYQNFIIHTIEALDFDRKQTAQELLTTAKAVIQSYKNKHKKMGQKIQNSIKQGKAVGISTCGTLFSDTVKKRYSNCLNHVVAATGTKCENGRLKIELTNSWGIGCAEDESTQHIFKCQRDQDGLTNGRAWVDFEYLSDQGVGLYSF